MLRGTRFRNTLGESSHSPEPWRDLPSCSLSMECPWVEAVYSSPREIVTQSRGLGDLEDRNELSASCGGWKPNFRCSQGWFLLVDCAGGSFQASLLWWSRSWSSSRSRGVLPGGVYVQISLVYEDISHTELGPTLLTATHLIASVKTPSPKDRSEVPGAGWREFRKTAGIWGEDTVQPVTSWFSWPLVRPHCYLF